LKTTTATAIIVNNISSYVVSSASSHLRLSWSRLCCKCVLYLRLSRLCLKLLLLHWLAWLLLHNLLISKILHGLSDRPILKFFNISSQVFTPSFYVVHSSFMLTLTSHVSYKFFIEYFILRPNFGLQRFKLSSHFLRIFNGRHNLFQLVRVLDERIKRCSEFAYFIYKLLDFIIIGFLV
jgi:hypothetical protein